MMRSDFLQPCDEAPYEVWEQGATRDEDRRVSSHDAPDEAMREAKRRATATGGTFELRRCGRRVRGVKVAWDKKSTRSLMPSASY